VSEVDFRLADFFKWGHLLSEAFGYGGGEFAVAMVENLKSQHDADQENNVVVDAFLRTINEDLQMSLATEDKPCRIASKCLYDKVTEKATSMGVNMSRKWPKTPQDFIRKLNESKDTIVYKGWNYERYHVENERGVDLWRITKNINTPEENIDPKTLPIKRTSDATDTDDTNYNSFNTTRKTEKTTTPQMPTENTIVISHVLPAEPCHGCQNFAVENIITIPNQHRTFRFCKSCCDRLVKCFSNMPVVHQNRGA